MDISRSESAPACPRRRLITAACGLMFVFPIARLRGDEPAVNEGVVVTKQDELPDLRMIAERRGTLMVEIASLERAGASPLEIAAATERLKVMNAETRTILGQYTQMVGRDKGNWDDVAKLPSSTPPLVKEFLETRELDKQVRVYEMTKLLAVDGKTPEAQELAHREMRESGRAIRDELSTLAARLSQSSEGVSVLVPTDPAIVEQASPELRDRLLRRDAKVIALHGLFNRIKTVSPEEGRALLVEWSSKRSKEGVNRGNLHEAGRK